MMRLLRLAIAILALCLMPASQAAELPLRPLAIGGHKLVAEVATTPEQRSTGLMHRFSLRPDHGMLFVFERPERLSFWMRNTFIPLSIAFIGADGRIVNIEDMAPQTEASHWSSGAALYALEMRKGWFAERGIRAGDVVQGLPGRPGVR
ncbi:MAG: DUF192 domain-containing protein [Betaproteobacteria bacterium]|nr:DUF192 domain-containing protein [Betaproteobacteria bacterium]